MNRTGIVVAVAVAAVVAGVMCSRRPWQELGVQNAKTRTAVEDMNRAQAEKAELVGRLSRLQNPAGREALARERGYRKPGETSFDEKR
ncbi:MAG: hypothetical protein JST30_13555 [Armatimonadetes bacterium]|nr:hypothetical protein [Armatimonadota bacterium]